MQIQKLLDIYGIQPNPDLDQFFLIDDQILDTIVQSAQLKHTDVVLEIGAGVGNLTYKLSQYAGRVITFEIDKRFRPILDKLPNNVEVRYSSAMSYFQLRGKYFKTKEYNKVIANVPYSLLEPLLHNLTFLIYDKVILTIPLKSLNMIYHNPIFASFFRLRTITKVSKTKFYPVPKTNSVVIDLIKIEDSITTGNLGLFLRQYIYQHEKQLVKNALMFGLIKWFKLVDNIPINRNQARDIIKKTSINKGLLERRPDNPKIYELVQNRFKLYTSLKSTL